MGNKKSKGFFFVLIILLILIYIVGSISLMVRTLEIAEKRAADNFKSSNIEAAISQITPEKMQDLARIATYGALVNLNSHAIDHPAKPGNTAAGEWEFKYINRSMYALVLNGSADGANFADGEKLDAGKSGSLSAWADDLNESLSKVGLMLMSFSLSNFSINQINYSDVDYSFMLNISVGSNDGSVSLTRLYALNGSINITGMVDPAIWREGKKKSPGLELKKQFFFHGNYPDPQSLRPEPFQKKGSVGQGWFYGPVVLVGSAKTVNETNRSKWILVGSYNDIVDLVEDDIDYMQFGGYILTNKPKITDACGSEDETFNAIQYKLEGVNCKVDEVTDEMVKPFVVIEGFKLDQMPQDSMECPEGKCLLFIAKHDPQEVENDPTKKNKDVDAYGIEALRDFATCNYYVNNDKAPSYFQRLFTDSYQRNSTLGIETFLIGNFIGGSGTDQNGQPFAYWSDDYSRLDRELFNDKDVKNKAKIRGMPGCKSKQMCSNDSPVGHFTLGKGARDDYLGAQDISCVNGMAKCE